MRNVLQAVALGITIGLAVPGAAHAQQFFGNSQRSPIVNVPIDTSAALAPFPQGTLTMPVPQQSSGLFGFNLFARLFGGNTTQQPVLNQLPRVNVQPQLTTPGSFGINRFPGQ